MSSQARAYCFTLNNPDEDEVLVPQTWPDNYNYLVYQVEEGTEGTRHLQGYINFKNPVRFESFRKYFPGERAHIERAKGTAKQNRAYCTKTEGRVDGPWEFGDMPEQGKRNDLLAMKADLDAGASLQQISEDYTGLFLRYSRGIKEYRTLHFQHSNEAKTVKCYWGSTGVGKTRKCYEEHPDAYWKTRSVGTSQWWDGYDGQSTIVIDEFYGWFPWDFLLRLTDRYPLQLECKGGSVPCAATTIIFTSNKHPREWYPNSKYEWNALNPLKRRFGDNITELVGTTSMDVVPREPVATYRNGLPVVVDLSEDQI